MAITSNMIKKRYENLSVEELEAKYKELEKNYCFNNKDEQISYVINNYLNVSKRTNDNSAKKALEELLKEKTGKEYKIYPKEFEITLIDIINYVTNPEIDVFWTNTLYNYFQKLEEIKDDEKIKFLIELVQDKPAFNEFTKEILQTENFREIYEKYKKIARDYVVKNSKKG